MTEQKGPRLVERTVDVLMALADGPQDFSTVCQRVDLSKATVHRILSGLGYADFVLQDPVTHQYLLGPGSRRLANAASLGYADLAILARPVLEGVVKATRETVILHVRMGSMRVNIDELISPQELRYSGGIGTSVPIHVGSAGKVLLAWLPRSAAEQLVPDIMEALTATTITDRAELFTLLDEVREAGYAESLGERIQGLAAISVPIFDPNGEVFAAMSILGPEARLPHEARIELTT